MTLRQEKPSDYDSVCALVKKSFSTNADDDATTHDYLNALRGKACFVPELSLVAEHDNGEIVGQIVLYKTDIAMADMTTRTELVLSPICVAPEHFLRGIARAMTERALEIAKELGYRAVFLCGDPKIYRRLGFSPTYEYAIFHISDAAQNAEWCMVRELVGGALAGVSGTVDIV